MAAFTNWSSLASSRPQSHPAGEESELNTHCDQTRCTNYRSEYWGNTLLRCWTVHNMKAWRNVTQMLHISHQADPPGGASAPWVPAVPCAKGFYDRTCMCRTRAGCCCTSHICRQDWQHTSRSCSSAKSKLQRTIFSIEHTFNFTPPPATPSHFE